MCLLKGDMEKDILLFNLFAMNYPAAFSQVFKLTKLRFRAGRPAVVLSIETKA